MNPAERDPELERHARAIARHLIGEDARPEECARWAEAVATVAAPLAAPRDVRLWALATGRPATLGLVDAGLALTDPYSPVRQRLCLMLAILEASPAHVRRFEARPLGPFDLAGFVFQGARAVVRSACGLVLVRSWGLLWR